jgi:hypothetical protein
MILKSMGHLPWVTRRDWKTCDPRTPHDGYWPCFFALWDGRLRDDSGLYNTNQDRRDAQPQNITGSLLQQAARQGGWAHQHITGSVLQQAARQGGWAHQHVTGSFLQKAASQGGWAHPHPYGGVHLHPSPRFS